MCIVPKATFIIPKLRPGSDEARASGCKCPVIDNHYGRGYGGDGERNGWVMAFDCPVHGRTERTRRNDAFLKKLAES